MAVLGKIRALGPVALISVIGLALFAFVLSTGTGSIFDVFKSDEFNVSTIAKVNGIEMDREDFTGKVKTYNIEKNIEERKKLAGIEFINYLISENVSLKL